MDKTDQAISILDKLIRLGPQAEYFNLKGSCFLKLGNKRKAIECFKRSLTLQPDNLDAKQLLAQAQGK
jgi:tetratricopeptide (TPR) repeat protein